MIFRRIESKEMKREGTEKDEHSPSTRDALGVTRSGSLREGTEDTESHRGKDVGMGKAKAKAKRA